MPGPQVWNGTTQISLTPQKSACGKFVSGDDWRRGRATRKQPDGWHLRFRSEVAGKLSHKRMGQESPKISISSPFTSTPCGDIFRFGLRGRQAVKNEPILAALRNCEGDTFSHNIAVLNYPITEDEDSLQHVAKLRIVPVNAFNHDCTGHAIEILASAFLVRVRVIPIQPRRRIEWNITSIVQQFPWHRHHSQDIILLIFGRNVQAVKMQIAHVLAERERAFLV